MAGLLKKSVNASIAVAVLAFFIPAVYAADPAIQLTFWACPLTA
jgi:hypothetical protein